MDEAVGLLPLSTRLWQLRRDMVRRIRGWDSRDVDSLMRRIYADDQYEFGIIRLSRQEFLAFPEFKNRVAASLASPLNYDFLAHVEGRGLIRLQKPG